MLANSALTLPNKLNYKITITSTKIITKIYKIENEDYWLAVELNKTKISQRGVDTFVAENQKYFKDWVFNLNDEQGQFLYETKAANIVDKYSK